MLKLDDAGGMLEGWLRRDVRDAGGTFTVTSIL